MLAHVLPNNIVPAAAQWCAIAMIAAGGLGVMRRHQKLLDTASWGVFSVGAAGCLVMVGIAMVSPPAPGYRLSLALGAPATTHMQLTVCATNPDGSAAKTPDADHVLAVLVDGAQVDSGTGNRFAVQMSPGRHTLRAELLTRDHREFNPAVAADVTVTVSAGVGSAGLPDCPHR